MRLHERVQITNRAEAELRGLLLEWLERHDLTWAEALRCVRNATMSWLHHIVSVERHGAQEDVEFPKKADEA